MARITFLGLFLFFCCGCTTSMSSKQLERVAKDWCLTIRASQVMPFYPLTEDLQPGDVFLVDTPIEDQIRTYKSKGYLSLVNQVARLQPDNYESFYLGRYGITAGVSPPGHWQFPQNKNMADYSNAPLSAFPSYSFSVSQKEGLSVALPIQGIPVGLNLMGSGSAHGSISLTDTYTYGIDMLRMWELINMWAGNKVNREFLKQFVPHTVGDSETQQYHYLRVVNRVYLTGKVNIALFNDDDFAGEVSGGVPKSVGLLNFANYSSGSNSIVKINKLIAALPGGIPDSHAAGQGIAVGGTLQLAMASNRSVSLVETFRRPLVIGFIAFDLPILAEGKLGPPVSTANQLNEIKSLKGTNVSFAYEPDDNTSKIWNWLNNDKQANYPLLADWLKPKGMTRKDIPKVLNSYDYRELRSQIVEYFKL